tara:strand:+ start:7273 stop:7383 length:111 start_codon:yes stop_codon:yes gene_type:complete
MGSYKELCKHCGKEIPSGLPLTITCLNCLIKRRKKK